MTQIRNPLIRILPLCVALAGGLAMGCTEPGDAGSPTGRRIEKAIWFAPKTLYIQATGATDTRLYLYQWQPGLGIKADTGLVGSAIVPQLVAAHDRVLLLLDKKSNRYFLYDPKQRALTPLPLWQPTSTALGWDSQGRLIVVRTEAGCGHTVMAAATGSDSGAVIAEVEQTPVALAPTGDAIAFPSAGGIAILPLVPTGSGSLVLNTNGYNFSWATRGRLVILNRSYRWAFVDPHNGRSEPFPETPWGMAASPDDDFLAFFSSRGLVVSNADATWTHQVIRTADLSSD